jgi:hypothetical protein
VRGGGCEGKVDIYICGKIREVVLRRTMMEVKKRSQDIARLGGLAHMNLGISPLSCHI